MALTEAKRVFKNWKKLEVDWLDMYPALSEKKKKNSELDLVEDLMDLDMGVLYTSPREDRHGQAALWFDS